MTRTLSPIKGYFPWSKPRPLRTEEDYQKALAEIEYLMHSARSPDDDNLLDLLVLLVETYEAQEEPLPESDPQSMLLFLMEQRGLAQADLVGVIGSSGVVSEVTNGKREISKGQAKKLGEFFSVDYRLFL